MRRAKKKVHPMPKLGWKDLLLYWTGMLITGGGAVLAIFYPLVVREDIVFRDTNVIASSGRGGIHFMWITIWLTVMCCLIAVAYERRYPVFGRSDIKYGPPAYPRTFPLLMKNKPQYWVSPSRIALRKKVFCFGTVVMLVFLLISVRLYPSTLYERADLYQNGSITVVNSDNEVEKSYGRGEVESVSIQTRRQTRRRSVESNWYVDMIISLGDGEKFWFSNTDFRGDTEAALQAMLSLKQCYNCPMRIGTADHLNKVVQYYELNEYETSLLYQLFE